MTPRTREEVIELMAPEHRDFLPANSFMVRGATGDVFVWKDGKSRYFTRQEINAILSASPFRSNADE